MLCCCEKWSRCSAVMLFIDDDDETATNSESVVSKSHLSELCSEAAKLKSMGVMNQVHNHHYTVVFA